MTDVNALSTLINIAASQSQGLAPASEAGPAPMDAAGFAATLETLAAGESVSPEAVQSLGLSPELESALAALAGGAPLEDIPALSGFSVALTGALNGKPSAPLQGGANGARASEDLAALVPPALTSLFAQNGQTTNAEGLASKSQTADQTIANAFPELKPLIEGLSLSLTAENGTPANQLAPEAVAARPLPAPLEGQVDSAPQALLQTQNPAVVEAALNQGATGDPGNVASIAQSADAANSAATAQSLPEQASARASEALTARAETAETHHPAQANPAATGEAQAVDPVPAALQAAAAQQRPDPKQGPHTNPVKGSAQAQAQAAQAAQAGQDGTQPASSSAQSSSGGQTATQGAVSSSASNGQNSGAGGQHSGQQDHSQGQAQGQTQTVKTAIHGPKPETAGFDPLLSSKPDSQAWTPEKLTGLDGSKGFDGLSAGLSSLKGDSIPQGQSILSAKSPSILMDAARQMQVAVTKAVEAGEAEFTLRLQPQDLGRLTVKLQFNENGTVRANVLVQNPETLELLQRDMRGLERAVEAGGHKLASDGMTFSLDKGDQESAGRALAEAMMEEKMRDELAARSGQTGTGPALAGEADNGETTEDGLGTEIPLEDILPYVSLDTGVDIHV